MTINIKRFIFFRYTARSVVVCTGKFLMKSKSFLDLNLGYLDSYLFLTLSSLWQDSGQGVAICSCTRVVLFGRTLGKPAIEG
jgi:hypothetical protein